MDGKGNESSRICRHTVDYFVDDYTCKYISLVASYVSDKLTVDVSVDWLYPNQKLP